jgi:hypothetical protein
VATHRQSDSVGLTLGLSANAWTKEGHSTAISIATFFFVLVIFNYSHSQTAFFIYYIYYSKRFIKARTHKTLPPYILKESETKLLKKKEKKKKNPTPLLIIWLSLSFSLFIFVIIIIVAIIVFLIDCFAISYAKARGYFCYYCLVLVVFFSIYLIFYLYTVFSFELYRVI